MVDYWKHVTLLSTNNDGIDDATYTGKVHLDHTVIGFRQSSKFSSSTFSNSRVKMICISYSTYTRFEFVNIHEYTRIKFLVAE